jgi:hypothetical protein
MTELLYKIIARLMRADNFISQRSGLAHKGSDQTGSGSVTPEEKLMHKRWSYFKNKLETSYLNIFLKSCVCKKRWLEDFSQLKIKIFKKRFLTKSHKKF